MKVYFTGGCADGKYAILPDNTHTWRFPVPLKENWFVLSENTAKYSPDEPCSYNIHEYRKTGFFDNETGANIFKYCA